MLRVLIFSALCLIIVGKPAASGPVASLGPLASKSEHIKQPDVATLVQMSTDAFAAPTPSPTPGFSETKCRRIADLSSKSRPVFIEKPDGEWECSYQLEYSETGHNPSVFLRIRGFEAGVWSSFRLKLNFGSILSRQALGERAANLVYTLIGEYTPMRELAITLGAGREFEISFEGITLRYRQERFDGTRFNLSGTNRPVPPRAPSPSPPVE